MPRPPQLQNHIFPRSFPNVSFSPWGYLKSPSTVDDTGDSKKKGLILNFNLPQVPSLNPLSQSYESVGKGTIIPKFTKLRNRLESVLAHSHKQKYIITEQEEKPSN